MPHLTQIPTSLHSTDHELTSLLRILEAYAHAKHAAPFVPRFDLEEHETTYELYGDFPGVTPNDIIVSAIDDRSLEIKGVVRPRSALEEVGSVDHSIAVQHPHGIPAPAAPVEKPKSEQPARAAEDGGPAETAEERPMEKAQQKPVEEKAEEKKETKKETQKVKMIISERQTGEFHRVFHFPTPVELGEGVKARMDNGVLHVSIPRGPPPKPVQVDVSWIPYYGL
jgi:HSP20 family molecular chaperone IbpA